MEPVRLEIAPEVNLDYVRSDKFKTGTLSVQLITPINEKTVSFGALLPSVLRRGTMSHPDMRSLSTALDLLYGSSIGCTVRKKGENQCIGFAASFIDEEFVPGGEKLLEPMCDLLGELLLDPVTRNGRFLNDYVESEKQNLIDAIRGIINDKRDYADLRLLQEMCRGERYGVDKFGSIARVEKITNQTLFRYYQELLSTAHLELFYCGSAERERVEGAITSERRAQVGSGMRNERIRTYNFPQNRVTDHRLTGENKNFNISAVMNGDLDPIIDALTMQEQAEKLRESTEA